MGANSASFNLAESYQQVEPKLDKFYVAFIGAMHVGAVAALFYFSWARLLSTIVIYTIAGLGITVGYHRLLTHKSFTTPKWLERVWATMGTLPLEGGPIIWVAQHRQHHMQSDTVLDPHNIKEGFFHAHFFWIFMRYPQWYEDGQRNTFAKDLAKDAYYRWLDRFAYLPPAALGLALFLIGGAPLFLWGFCLRIVVCWHATWLVNSAAHKWGYRPFGKEIATNNWWVAIMALGEGWHNNHHAFPNSARHGLRFWEFDISWLTIRSLKLFGLASKVKTPAWAELPWKKAKLLKKGLALASTPGSAISAPVVADTVASSAPVPESEPQS